MMSKKYSILVVEDEPSMITLIRYNLEMAGYQFYSARNGRDAIAFCQKTIPDLIISDIGMPEIDGFELREFLLNDEKFRKIPFIFLTAKTQGEDQFRSMRLGVSNFLTKPFEPELLLITVKDVLNLLNKTE
jgi:two-component system alkaline phosphatase synthesis response regulator PhoP